MRLGGTTLIEAASLEPHLSCWIDPITRLGPRLPFTDLRTLEDALAKAFEAIAQTSSQTSHLLILSAHGVERTGTALSVGHMQIDPWMAAHCFKALPENVIVFLSACWGAYPGPVGAIRRYPKNQPVIVGPVVQINKSQNEKLLRSLVEAIETADGPVDDAVWRVAQDYNMACTRESCPELDEPVPDE